MRHFGIHRPGFRSARTSQRSALVLFLVLGLSGMALAAGALFGPLAAAVTPFAIALLVAALRDYRVATWLTVFMLPIGPSNLIGHDMLGISPVYLVHALLLVTISSLLLSRALHPGRLALPRWPRMFWLFVAVFVGSALYGSLFVESIPDYFVVLKVVTSTSVRDYLMSGLVNPALALAGAIVLSIAIRNASRPALYLIPLFASATVFALFVFYFAVTSGGSLNDLASQDSRQYLSAAGMHANELGLLLNTALALALFSASHAKRFALKAALAVLAAVFGLAVLLTFSRGTWLGTLAVLGYLMFVRRNFVLFALALLVLPVAVLLMPESVTQRATHEVGGNDVDALSSGRVDEIWLPLLPEILKHPVLGGGEASILWSDAAKQHTILPVGHPHSAYLGALLDLGVVGTGIVLLFYMHMWRRFKWLATGPTGHLWQGFFHGGAACILLLFVQGMTDDSFLPGRTQTYMWLSYGIAVGFASRLKASARSAATAPASARGMAGVKERVQ